MIGRHIKENMEAVRSSSAVIKKNAEQIQELSSLMGNLTPSPFAIKLIALVLGINLFLIPLLMMIFMWRIHRDMRWLRHKT